MQIGRERGKAVLPSNDEKGLKIGWRCGKRRDTWRRSLNQHNNGSFTEKNTAE
jgi:hypothetical protein